MTIRTRWQDLHSESYTVQWADPAVLSIDVVGKAGSHRAAMLVDGAPELLAASAGFLRWFETFMGKEAMAEEITCAELTALRTALRRAGA